MKNFHFVCSIWRFCHIKSLIAFLIAKIVLVRKKTREKRKKNWTTYFLNIWQTNTIFESQNHNRYIGKNEISRPKYRIGKVFWFQFYCRFLFRCFFGINWTNFLKVRVKALVRCVFKIFNDIRHEGNKGWVQF